MVFTVNEFIYSLQSAGIFDFLLPFLLVFAIVFGILQQIKIFGDNKGIHIILAFVIGLMAIRWEFLNQFYSDIFPRLGVGITVLLVIMILVGMFIANDESRYWGWGFAAVAAVVAIIVLYQSFSFLGWTGFNGFFGGEAIGWIVFGILIVGLIIAIATSSGGGGGGKDKTAGEALFEGMFRKKSKGER